MYLSIQFTFFQPKHFNLGIREDGSDFNEDIYIDEEKGKVLLRVPTHNNIDGASFLNDFNLVRTRPKFQIKETPSWQNVAFSSRIVSVCLERTVLVF